MSELPADHFTKKRAFTQKVYRDEYPAISPEQAKLSQEGKVIVITGASQGIGSKGFAKQFLRASPKAIVLAARNPEKLAETKDMLMTLDKPEVEIQLVPTDISNPKEVVALFKIIEDTYGHADVLVNNAGVYECFPDRIGDAKLEDWWNGFEINVKGSFLITQQFLRLLGQNPGTIINLSSYSALYMDPGESAYALSKLVNLQMATTIAIEYPNVVSVSMNPGMVESPMTLEPFRRFSRDTPELAGGVAVWLASKEGEFMNGRFMDTNWDVEELVERRDEIVKTDLFKLGLRGTESGLLR